MTALQLLLLNLLYDVLCQLRERMAPGMTTLDLDRYAHELITHAHATPSFLGYEGYPATLCVSIDDEVVHGIPSKHIEMKEGSIVSVDCGLVLDGWQADSAFTKGMGQISPECAQLIEVTERCFFEGARQAVDGNRLGDIGHAVQQLAESYNYGVIRDLTGHGIGREMHKRYKRWHAATVVTQIECDPDDPAFKNPTKPIGPFYTEEQAKEFMAEDPSKVFVEDSGRGWRRVVASPDPKKIVEADSILNLLDNEFIVIACGGGGIPVVRDYENKGCYKGVPAVIDKDLGGELLAEDCDADVLFLLTAVEHVAINFGKPNQEELEDITADEAERLADEGQFGKGSMEPKVRAAIKFARSRKGRTCIIGALDKAAETMAGLSGTRIHE
mgnify:CR=1 FL=1